MADETSIGIDIGGTNIKAIVAGGDGMLGPRAERPTPMERAALLDAIRALVDVLGPAAHCGLASPGLAARDHRSVVWMQGRLDAVQGLDWTRELGRGVAVLNDAHAATLGEAWLGAGRGIANMLLLTLGTGVGGGIILDGRLISGAEGKAGHLGHISLDPGGPADIVNTPGSLEYHVGDYSVRHRSGGRFANTVSLTQAVEAGDPEAEEIWEKSITYLGAALVSFVNCFDPEVIVIGGGIAAAGALLFEPLQAYLDLTEWRPTGRQVKLVPAQLGEFAGAIGAARFALMQAALSKGDLV